MTLPLLMTPPLPFARYRFQFTVTRPIRLPDWSGSLLRGAFGHALRRLSCMLRQPECADCPLLRTCPYPAIFAPPAVEHAIKNISRQPPVPYLIEPEKWGACQLPAGETLQFDMALMGRALHELPLITQAWKNAGEHGLGPGDGTAELREIHYLPPSEQPVSIYNPENKRLTEISLQPVICPPAEHVNELTLRFISPLRLQENGHALTVARLTPGALLMAAVRRAALIHNLYGDGTPEWDFKALAQQAASVEGEKDLHWQDWTRRSARQQQTMQLGGVMGEWTLRGNLQPFWTALHWGKWLHVGKETVFGLGRYELEYN
ncbi:CRISPR-associated protein Cas6 [Betaproteobacteria bacterium]|nr:CRISPR-associated protein Cas6 [Betaproteobacteria bacterium]